MKSIFKQHLMTTALLAVVGSGLAQPAWADGDPKPNQFWWPNQLDLSPLRSFSPESNPYGKDFDYAKEFQTLDLQAVKNDIKTVLTTSQAWWPSDYGNYGPFFIRMAWHSAGTYRMHDGRGGGGGGQQRFEPLNSWPDNGNLDKARRLLWPVKKKYGRKLSWGDLMILTGNVSLEAMGFKTFGFAGGRADDWEPDLVYWGPGAEFMSNNRSKDGKLEKPLAAIQMGLIYVNPEGPNGNGDPLSAAKDIRESFGRMAMNDEETVALIAGGHSFGKAHGAKSPKNCVGAAPAGEGLEQQGLGWVNKCGKGKGADTITSGLEGAWTVSPATFTTQYFDNLFNNDWVKTKSPAGAIQWKPKNAANIVPDAHDPTKNHPLMMLTTDLALKFDPAYSQISKRFHDNPEEFKLAFAKAWFKLTHRDMGPRARYLGAEVPGEVLAWQDPVPVTDYKPIVESDVDDLKAKLLQSGLSQTDLIKTAWAAAANYRNTDKRGGVNGARIRLAPQKDWAVNDPVLLAKTLPVLERVQGEFNKENDDGKQVSIADLIVLGGNAALEVAAKKAGVEINVPFTPGRTDATQAQTDVQSFAVLEPTADGFRNYYNPGGTQSPIEALVDHASKLSLSVPEMTVLVGGLRVLNANHASTQNGLLTSHPGTLTNDFFVNLLDMSTEWRKSSANSGTYMGYDRATGALKWTASPVDLVFGSNSELRAVAEAYASDDAKEQFVNDFVKAWTKVMNLDRFDL